MVRYVAAAAAVTYLLAVLQSTVAGRLAIAGVSPDLLFVWTVAVGLMSGPAPGALAGWGAGLLEGGLQQVWLAPYAISKTISGFVAGQLGARMLKENWVVPAVCAGALTLLNEAIFLLLARPVVGAEAWRRIGIRVVYHAALAPLALALAYRGRRLLLAGREERA